MNSLTVATAITEIQGIGDTVLTTLGEVDPAVELPAAAAEPIVNLLASLASKALTAWSAASSTPITMESVQALMPNATPLTPPTA